MNLKDALRGTLKPSQLAQVRGSFDSVGDIAILEIPRALRKQERVIVSAFQKLHPHFKVIAKKTGGHGGKYRVQALRVIGGDKRTVTEHKESGLRIRVDVAKAYFSPRLSTERLRIAKLVKKGENVLVLFSGVAPYALVIARHAFAKHVTAVELNPAAHHFAEENIMLNKLQGNVTAVKADAKKWCMKSKEKFDRIIMPLPMTADKFLLAALRLAKKNATVHFYAFADEINFAAAEAKVVKACVKAKKKCKIVGTFRVGQQSPRVYRVSVDFKVT
ncbi:MAG TPA: class I SAM-dependent methyltransferase family protein [Candidatus Binatia bacterium]|nr:class I SAM-dependent methyltransferase family protein [Candidatus Binatia bacterium]